MNVMAYDYNFSKQMIQLLAMKYPIIFIYVIHPFSYFSRASPNLSSIECLLYLKGL